MKNEKIANHIVEKYIPFVPMWSAIVLSKVAPTIKRVCNAYSESGFNKKKHGILKGQKHLSAARYVEESRRYNNSVVSYENLDVNLKNPNMSSKDRYPTVEDNPLEKNPKDFWKGGKNLKSHKSGYMNNVENRKQVFTSKIFEDKVNRDLKKKKKCNITKQDSTTDLQTQLSPISCCQSDETIRIDKLGPNLEDDGIELISQEKTTRQLYKPPISFDNEYSICGRNANKSIKRSL